MKLSIVPSKKYSGSWLSICFCILVLYSTYDISHTYHILESFCFFFVLTLHGLEKKKKKQEQKETRKSFLEGFILQMKPTQNMKITNKWQGRKLRTGGKINKNKRARTAAAGNQCHFIEAGAITPNEQPVRYFYLFYPLFLSFTGALN